MSTTDSTGVFQQKHPWMQTHLGKRFRPTQPILEDIEIEDIAHALSLQCRYAGHVREFYSVAEHSVRIARICPKEHALWGLMHDSPEAYLQDMIRPLKCVPGLGDTYRQYEDELLRQIAMRFDLPWPMPEVVKLADNILLFTEQRDLIDVQLPWSDSGKYTRLSEVIVPWSPKRAEEAFLVEFWGLWEPKELYE